MRLGGPVFADFEDPEQWARQVQKLGYRSAVCPVRADADDATVKAYQRAAAEADIVIAEVGAWSNPISPDEAERKEALAKCKKQLDLADRIGARCCVNIAGGRGSRWDGPDADNFSDETFARIMESVREIIDEVKPTRTYYTLEPMPWIPPDSPDSYLELIKGIDRERFAVHFDPINIITDPRKFYRSGEFLRECFGKLGPQIKSVHAKDMIIDEDFTVHLTECRPGLGQVDYRTFLKEMDKLDPDLPILLEHLPDAEQYRLAAGYVRKVAGEVGVNL